MRASAISCIVLFSTLILNGLQAQTIIDIDGNKYPTVKIGSQVWMKENLKVTRYNNGNAIETTTSDTFSIIGEEKPKYQWAYDGKECNVGVYGRLYTWYAVTDERNLCPVGWHVPSEKEWLILIKNLGGVENAKNKLKSSTNHWLEKDSLATNESGFTSLPSGKRSISGVYIGMGKFCSWWSSSEQISAYNNILFLPNKLGNQIPVYNQESSGLAVRCLKD